MPLVGTVTGVRSCAPATLASPTATLTRSASSASTTATVPRMALVWTISALGLPVRDLGVLSRLARSGTG